MGWAAWRECSLFAIGVYVFLYSFAGPGQNRENDMRTVKLLFWLGAAGALFACADFYFQLPAPAGYSDQFVWLDEGVLRRAQGLFYEASTLGNVCAFFLTMIAVALFRKREQSPFSKTTLLAGGLALAGALMFSYSRASVFNVAIAVCVLASIRVRRFRRSFLWIVAAGIVACAAVNLLLPSFSSNYWGRLLGSFSFFWQSPDAVLSGRLSHWQALLDFLAREPWHAIFGIGYKTLPYSNFAGAATVADNTYLDLLVETGIIGLAAFLFLNAMILRTAWRAVRSANPTAAFLGEWIFCFWCGQMVQMFSGDLITYWRALPVYFWVLGAAARQTQERREDLFLDQFSAFGGAQLCLRDVLAEVRRRGWEAEVMAPGNGPLLAFARDCGFDAGTLPLAEYSSSRKAASDWWGFGFGMARSA